MYLYRICAFEAPPRCSLGLRTLRDDWNNRLSEEGERTVSPVESTHIVTTGRISGPACWFAGTRPQYLAFRLQLLRLLLVPGRPRPRVAVGFAFAPSWTCRPAARVSLEPRPLATYGAIRYVELKDCSGTTEDCAAPFCCAHLQGEKFSESKDLQLGMVLG